MYSSFSSLCITTYSKLHNKFVDLGEKKAEERKYIF